MALFAKKKKDEAVESPKQAPKAASATPIARDLAHILVSPRITEKATMHQMIGVYTFDIGERATKRDVIQAVQKLYKVTPRMVRVVSIPTKLKRNMRTGKSGIRGGGRKAYVYLKKGETITIA